MPPRKALRSVVQCAHHDVQDMQDHLSLIGTEDLVQNSNLPSELGLDQNTTNSSSSSDNNKTRRGRYKGVRLMRARSAAGGTLVAYVSDKCKVIGLHSGSFSSECSRAAKELWPLGKLTLSQFEPDVLKRVVPFVRRTFTFKPSPEVEMNEIQLQRFNQKVDGIILSQAAKCWTNWRSGWHGTYKKCTNFEEWLALKPQEVLDDQWHELTMHFSDEDSRNEVGKLLKIGHTKKFDAQLVANLLNKFVTKRKL